MKSNKFSWLFACSAILTLVLTTNKVSADVNNSDTKTSISTKADESINNLADTHINKNEQDSDLPIDNASSKPNSETGTEKKSAIIANEASVIKSTWGTAPIIFDKSTGNLKIGKGTITSPMYNSYIDVEKSIDKADIKTINFTNNVIAPQDSKLLFAFKNLTNINNTKYLNTSNVINMNSMFAYCNCLSDLDLSTWDTSKVTNMSQMFAQTGLSTLNLNNWNTSNVTDMSRMFLGSTRLATLKIIGWNTSKVANMYQMFAQTGLSTLNLNNWNTSNVTDMSQMFLGSANLINLNINTWDTSKVTNMYQMFYQYKTSPGIIENLNLSNWNTKNVADMGTMFYNLPKLKYLNISNFDTSNIINIQSMFYNAINLEKLVLGRKTIFSNNVQLPSIDKTSHKYTGRWIKEDTKAAVFTDSNNFMKHYDGKFPGTYIWEKVKPDKQTAGTVTVKYVDENGNEIHESRNLPDRNINDSYDATKYKLSNIVTEDKTYYTLDKTRLPINEKGKFTDKKQTITYIYNKDIKRPFILVFKIHKSNLNFLLILILEQKPDRNHQIKNILLQRKVIRLNS